MLWRVAQVGLHHLVTRLFIWWEGRIHTSHWVFFGFLFSACISFTSWEIVTLIIARTWSLQVIQFNSVELLDTPTQRPSGTSLGLAAMRTKGTPSEKRCMPSVDKKVNRNVLECSKLHMFSVIGRNDTKSSHGVECVAM